MFETTREAMDPHGIETNYYCMYAGEIGKIIQFVDVIIKDEGRGHNLNYVQEENEIAKSHVHAHVQLSESNDFQPPLKAKKKEDLAYYDGQEQREAKDDIKHSYVMLEKAKKKTNEGCLSP